MEFNKEKTKPNEVDSARIINALTEYIPTFFSPDGVLSNNKTSNAKFDL